MCVSETWSTKVSLKIFTTFPNKLIISPALKTSKFGRARGGLLLIFNKLIYKVSVLDISSFHIFVKVKSRTDCFILGSIYISPDSDIVQYLDNLNSILSFIKNEFPYLPVLIVVSTI